MLKIVGIDPSFRNFGTARMVYDRPSKSLSAVSLKLITPHVIPSVQLKGQRKNQDDLRRASVLHEGMLEVCKGQDLAIVEIPIGSQSARASVSYGVCLGVLSACPIPVVAVTPIQVKKVVGNREASKQDMIDWAYGLYPELNWLTRPNGKLLNANEHLADAIAAVHAGILNGLV